jgi:hypothetical protein
MKCAYYPFMTTPTPPPPTVVIYQNPIYVAGILQEMFDEGLIESREREQADKSTSEEASNTAGKGHFGVTVSIPTVAEATGELGADRGNSRRSGQEAGNVNRTRYSYSDSYYLHIIRNALRQVRQVRYITGSSNTDDIATGQFVEFAASFCANEINTILDIATPDLVAATAAYLHERKGQKVINALSDIDKITVEWQKYKLEAESRATFARAVTHAVRTDFRSNDTREFYGTIARDADPLTAITICDSAHFVAADHDRILDGEFTVLGKVISEPEQDVAVLDRNKVLSRIDPAFLETSLANLDIEAKAQAQAQGRGRGRGPGRGNATTTEHIIDTEFSATVAGTSFRVLPIAVYT